MVAGNVGTLCAAEVCKMLLEKNGKLRMCTYVVNSILTFIGFARENNVLDQMARCSMNKSSKEYQILREALIKEMVRSIEERELSEVFNEIEILLKKH